MSQSTFCRVCACAETTFDLVNIFEKHDGQECIAEMLQELAGLEVSEDDELPRFCCRRCQSDLTDAVAVRRKCLESDKIFQANLVGSNTEPYPQPSDSDIEDYISKQENAMYHCNECAIDFYDSAALQKHFEATHANAIYGWKSFGISEISLFDTTTDDEDEVKPTPVETKKNKNMSQNVLCCGCSMTFDTDAELRRHAETVHAPEAMETDEYRPFQCNLCYHVFTTPKGVAEHQSAKRVMRYQCATCGVRCGKYHQLLRHELTHTSERFACDCCEKHFSNTFALRKHKIARHQSDPTRTDDEKRHICNQCGKCLHSAEYLKQHMKLHSDHQAYSCPLCDARFKLKVYLRWHMAKHKGTYNCRVCHKTFKSPSELQMHAYRHSDRRDFDCSVCGKTFLTPHDRDRHIRKIHKKFKRKQP